MDPKLAEHLAHWGINMMMMEKTEKTMAELEIERNQVSRTPQKMESLVLPRVSGLLIQNLLPSCLRLKSCTSHFCCF